MKRIELLTVMLLVAGCGLPPGFAGKFSGTLTNSVHCPDGPQFSTTDQVTWTAEESATTVVTKSANGCSPLTWEADDGGVFWLREKFCPFVSGGWTFTGTVYGGSAKIDGGSLTIFEGMTDVLADPADKQWTCIVVTRGVLGRQP